MSRLASDVREYVRQRAQNRCEYCHKPEGYAAHKHQIDHIISQKHHGTDELNNLALACFRCNVSKGTDVAAYDPKTEQLVPFYNPRTQIWDEHFKSDNAELIGLTPTGRVTVEIFQFNHPDQLETRQMLIEAGLWF